MLKWPTPKKTAGLKYFRGSTMKYDQKYSLQISFYKKVDESVMEIC